MKKLILYIPFALNAFLFSCEDTDAVRVPEVEQVLNLRAVTETTSFDSTDPNASITLTYYSENTNFQTTELVIDHFKLSTLTTSAQVLLESIPGGVGNNGSTVKTYSLAQFIAPLDLVPDDLAGGDVINLYHRVTLTDGRVFPDTVLKGTTFETINVTPNIVNSSSTTSFTATLAFPIVCALTEGFATGMYLFEQVSGPSDPFFGEPTLWATEVVEVTAAGPTSRTFNGTYASFGGITFNFDLACNVVFVPEQDVGVSCGGPGFQFVHDIANLGTFDISDDAVITMNIFDNIRNGCGLPTSPMTVTLTKQ